MSKRENGLDKAIEDLARAVADRIKQRREEQSKRIEQQNKIEEAMRQQVPKSPSHYH